MLYVTISCEPFDVRGSWLQWNLQINNTCWPDGNRFRSSDPSPTWLPVTQPKWFPESISTCYLWKLRKYKTLSSQWTTCALDGWGGGGAGELMASDHCLVCGYVLNEPRTSPPRPPSPYPRGRLLCCAVCWRRTGGHCLQATGAVRYCPVLSPNKIRSKKALMRDR